MNQLKKHSYGIIGFIAFIVVISWLVSAYASNGIQNKQINFQGFLTDSSNKPLEGNYAITFRIYENAGDQTPIWAEHHASVTVIKGNASALLGSTNAMNLTFDQPRYLGIQVGNDPEMTPRQKILPSFQASAANKLVVTYANQSRGEFGVNNLVPIGGVISFYGDPANLPENWKVCDGSVINDPESPLNGTTLPDMRAKFVRGEENATRNLESGANTGGSDTIDMRHQHSIASDGTHVHSGTAVNAGSHIHTFNTGQADLQGAEGTAVDCTQVRANLPVSGMFVTALVTAGNTCVRIWGQQHIHSGQVVESGSHNHNLSIDNGGAHDHGGTTGVAGNASQDNRPSFIAMHYIIRIK